MPSPSHRPCSLVMPMIRPNHVGTFDCRAHDYPFTPPSRPVASWDTRRDTTFAVVAALPTVFTAFLLPGVALYCLSHALGHRRIGEVLRTGERRRVDPGLELALDEHRVTDVEHEPAQMSSSDHGKRSDDQDLAALVGRPTRNRLPGLASPQSRPRKITAH